MTAATQYRDINRVKSWQNIECITFMHAFLPSSFHIFFLCPFLSLFTDNLAYKEKWVKH
jgi:hypothetical protein